MVLANAEAGEYIAGVTGSPLFALVEHKREKEIQWIPAGELHVDVRYQRDLRPERVKRLVKQWDDRACGVITVNFREDGTLAVVDGQHRRAAHILVHGPQAPMACSAYYGLTAREEAGMFNTMNNSKGRQAVSALEGFKSRVFAQEPRALEIMACLDAAGIELAERATGAANMTQIHAIASAERLYDTGGQPLLHASLALLRDSWHGSKNAYSAPSILGMGSFVGRYYGDYDRVNLVDKLSEKTPDEIARRAAALIEFDPSSTKSSGGAVGTIIRNIYNANKRKNLLPDLGQRNLSQKQVAERFAGYTMFAVAKGRED